MLEKILVVDDEKEIADLIEVYLQNENMDVYKFYSGEEALVCIGSTDFDLAILDIMLPDISGLSICQSIRSKEYTYPVIMLTAKDGETLSLTPTEFSILRILLERKCSVVSAEELFHEVWQEEYYTKSNNTITVHIRHLREKMKDTGENPRYIKTVWGGGYKIGEI